MVASIKPHRDELGLGDGRMLIDGDWVAAADAEAELVAVRLNGCDHARLPRDTSSRTRSISWERTPAAARAANIVDG